MPESSDAHDVLLNQLADEFAARQRAGERPRLEEYCDRNPKLADDIRSLFPALVELERAKADAGPELAVAIADAPPVTQLGDFRLLREVGRGGMGVVYEAEQVSLGRRVALKLLPATVFRDPTKRRRFEREAKAAARLHHTNIVPVHGFGEHDGTPYYVMQFIPGLGLDAVIDELGRLPVGSRTPEPRRPRSSEDAALSVALARSLCGEDVGRTVGWNGPAVDVPTLTAAGGATPHPASLSRPDRSSSVSISSSGVHLPGQSGSGVDGPVGKKTTYWESVARIGVQVSGALAYAHKLGVLHRDIKPANLLLDLDGIVWVTDFGLAKADDSDNLTHTGDLLGTLRYMPPEAFEGKSDARSDVYALGQTLFELVALRPAYEERDRNKLIKQVTTGDPPRLGKLRKDAPRDLVTIVEKSIDREPTRRYQSAGEMVDDLQRFLNDEPIQARRQTQLERYVRWARRNPGIAALGAVLTTVLFLVTVASLLAAGHFNRLRLNEAQAAQSERDARAAEAEQKGRAEEALRDAIDQTYLATRNEIRAMRLAHESGWRSAALERIRGLVRLGSRKLNRVELRTEALACLAEIDVRIQSHFANHDIGAWHLQFSPDGRMLAVSDQKGRVYLRDLAKDQELPSIPISKGGIAPVAFHPGGALAVPSAPGRVTFHALAPDQPTFPAIEGKGHAHNLAFSGSGERLAIAWRDEEHWADFRVTVHATATGATIRTILMPANSLASMYKVPLALSPDGKSVATTGPGFEVRMYSVEGESEPVVLGRLDGRICAVAFHPEGKSLAAAGHRVAALWNVQKRSELLRIHAPEEGFWDLAFSPDGQLLAGATNDGWGRLWDCRSGRELAAVPAQTGVGLSVAFSPQGDRFAVGGRAVAVLAIEGGRERRTETSQDNAVLDVVFDPIKPVLLHCGGNQRVYAWSLDKSVAEVNKLTIRLNPAVIRLAPGGREVVLGFHPFIATPPGQDYSLRVWPRDDPTAERLLKGPRSAVESIAIDATGCRIAAGSRDGGLYVWDFKAGSLLHRQELGASVTALHFLDDARLLVGSGRRLLLLSTDDSVVLQKLTMPGAVGAFVVIPDQPDALVGTSDGAIHRVRLPDLEIVQSRMVLDHPSNRMALSPDSSLLAATTQKGARAVLIDPRSLEPLAQLPEFEPRITSLAFDPKGSRFALSGSKVVLWDLALVRDELSRLGLDIGYENDRAAKAMAEPALSLANRFPGVLRGADKPVDNAERLVFAQIAHDRKQFALATRLWAEALDDPKLGDDPQTRHRYNAACAAALAAGGQGKDEPQLDEAAKAKLRRQALLWLRADLTDLGKLLESGPPQVQQAIMQTLSHWKQDNDLASIRDAAVLAKFPANERAAFTQLWSDVYALDTLLLLKAASPPLLKSAALHAWFGQDKELAAICDRALEAMKNTNDPTLAERTAKICSLRQSNDRTHAAALVLARRGVELGQENRYLDYFHMALGMAEYRSGHYAEAEAALLVASRLGKNNYRVADTAAFYRAMSLYRQGNEAEAHKLASEAVGKMKSLPKDENHPLADNVNHDDLILWLAYKEAKALIKFEAVPTAPAQSPPSRDKK